MLVSRASSDGQAVYCPGSIYLMNEKVPRVIHDDDHPATLGTRVHEMLARAIGTGEKIVFDETRDAEARYLFFACMDVWKEIKGLFDGEVAVELTLDADPELPGHCDLVIWDGERLAVLDWKTGRTIPAREQLIGYLGRVIEQFKWKPVECYYIIVTPRERDRDIQQVSLEAIEAHMAALRENVAKAKEIQASGGEGLLKHYTLGSHCDSCSARVACPALHLTLRSFVAAVTGQHITALSDMTDQEISMARIALKTLKQWEGEWDAGIKKRVDTRGPINLGGGKVLRRTSATTKEIVDPLAACRVVREMGGESPALTLSNGDFDAAVADAARAKGEKIGATKEAAWESLMKLKAAKKETRHRYAEARADEPEGGEK